MKAGEGARAAISGHLAQTAATGHPQSEAFAGMSHPAQQQDAVSSAADHTVPTLANASARMETITATHFMGET